jgi:hypothetical protein
VEWYNQWVTESGVGTAYTHDDIENSILEEIRSWHAVPKLT